MTSRVLAVARLHFVNKFQILYLPLLIMAFILIVNIVIWASVIGVTSSEESRAAAQHGFSYSGAMFFIFIYTLVIAVQAIARTFPYSLGFGVTRRDFYLGSALAFVILAALFSAVLTVMSIIEKATGGWGLGGHMFTPVYFTSDNPLLRFVMDFLLFVFCLFIGSAVASVYVRWKTTGIVVFFGAVAVIVLGAITILTLGRDWSQFGGWVGDTGALGIVTWTLVPTMVAAVAGFFILRRATPKN